MRSIKRFFLDYKVKLGWERKNDVLEIKLNPTIK
jgi:hypothetical protein